MRLRPLTPLGLGTLALLALHASVLLRASAQTPRPDAPTTAVQPPETTNNARVDFVRQIQPIFEQVCYECHGPSKGRGQLRLHDRRFAFKGGVSGTVIEPGKSTDSLLVHRLLGEHGPVPNEDRMPLDRDPLTDHQIALIRTWIDQGADWPAATRTTTAAPSTAASASPSASPSASASASASPSTATAASAVATTGPAPAAAHNGSEDADPATHWAYVKPQRRALPAVRDERWVKNPIDRFVLARLDREGLTPSPPAPRHTWLRRVTLDLTGLPPTPQELDAFQADTSPDADARARVVDRLLASPHYGERWARPWLDLARYADTNGHEKDLRRSIWSFRDWVIDAINDDMPFDRFTVEQIAGDMLPNATRAQQIASGFHRNAMTNEEGGVDPEESLYEVLVDRVNTTATVWLGSTIACAQCHNHKYDPFSQKDYYRLLAFFQQTAYTSRPANDGTRYAESTLDLASPEQEQRRAALDAEIARLEAVLKTPTPAIEAAQARWEDALRKAAEGWTPLAPSHVEATGGVTLTPQSDASVLAAGPNPELTTYTIVADTTVTGITALRIEALTDERLPKNGPGRDPYGHFRLTGVDVEIAPLVDAAVSGSGSSTGTHDDRSRSQPVTFDKVKVNDAVHKTDPDALLDRTDRQRTRKEGWIIDAMRDSPRVPRQAVLLAAQPFGFPGGTRITVRLEHLDGTLGQGLGKFRLSVTDNPKSPTLVVFPPARLRHVLNIPAAERTDDDRQALAEHYRNGTELLDDTRRALTAARKALAELSIPTTLVMKERASYERPSTFLRERGSFTARGPKIYAGVPAALHAWPESAPINRLGLAHWLVAPENPLVARVAVNRVWEQIFGRGLVETSEDFGTQGSPPSHPDLLDWLATEFVAHGWSQKALVRLIVTSATYAQDTRVTPALLERDPYNRLLAHGPRFRLDAEAVRDVALAASGLLSPKLHGPSVFPPQPDGIWNIPYNEEVWTTSTGEDRYRRSLYTFLRRTSPYPTQMAFDATSREVCTVRRVRTNTPLQALTLLNDEAFFEAAQALARRLSEPAAGTTPASRAAYGFRLVTSREPDRAELARLVSLYTTEVAHYRAHPADARRVRGKHSATAPTATAAAGPTAAAAAAGAAPAPVAAFTDAEAAAWTIVANVLLNLDETVTKG